MHIYPISNGLQYEGGVLRTACTETISQPCIVSSCQASRKDAATYKMNKEIEMSTSHKQIEDKIKYYGDEITKVQTQIDSLTSIKESLSDYRDTYETRLSELIERERKAEELKEQARLDKEARARATIAEQVASLSPERLVDLLVEQGLSQIGPKPDSARIILTEAYDTLAMSYWIKGDETRAAGTWDNIFDIQLNEKFIAVPTGDGKYRAVTGMCAVGALAMARAMQDGQPVEEWSSLMSRDRSAAIAAEALAWAIWQNEDYAKSIELGSKVASVITSWNDSPEREKDQVLETWKHALDNCPFLDMGDEDSLYHLWMDGVYFNHRYASEAEAQAALKRIQDKTPKGLFEQRVVSSFGGSYGVPEVRKVPLPAATYAKV